MLCRATVGALTSRYHGNRQRDKDASLMDHAAISRFAAETGNVGAVAIQFQGQRIWHAIPMHGHDIRSQEARYDN